MTLLSGCDRGLDGQIEKCVQAGLKAGEPYKDLQQKNDLEWRFRLACLQASAGKK